MKSLVRFPALVNAAQKIKCRNLKQLKVFFLLIVSLLETGWVHRIVLVVLGHLQVQNIQVSYPVPKIPVTKHYFPILHRKHGVLTKDLRQNFNFVIHEVNSTRRQIVLLCFLRQIVNFHSNYAYFILLILYWHVGLICWIFRNIGPMLRRAI